MKTHEKYLQSEAYDKRAKVVSDAVRKIGNEAGKGDWKAVQKLFSDTADKLDRF